MHLAARASGVTARADMRAAVSADVEPVPRKWVLGTVVIKVS
jgi:hypothetical protein